MSGSNVPYQLRPNKFVERQLFLDLLDFVRVWNGPSQYLYAAMGGRFLEDFKVIHERFAFRKMVSIELDEDVWKRQQFNKPFKFVECLHLSSRQFVDDFDAFRSSHLNRRFIVWLDHATANERGAQLGEFRDLVARLDSGDVAKLTLNANPGSIAKRGDFRQENHYRDIVISEVKEQLGEYFPADGMTRDQVRHDRFAAVLAEAIKNAATSGNAANTNGNIILLGLYRYNDDHHQMITATILLASDELKAVVDADSDFQSFPFRSKEWHSIHEIRVPDLSARERDRLDEEITEEIWPSSLPDLPFALDQETKEAEALLKSYVMHYRRYPTFTRVKT